MDVVSGNERQTTAPELAEYLGKVRARRAELGDSIRAVDEALEAAIARGGPWRERVRAALAELDHDFSDHICLTESPGGLYERIRRDAPRLSGPIDRLFAEHAPLREEIAGYLAVLEHGGTMADLPAFREELTLLVRRLRRHRQTGADLVYEAYDVDLGGSG
ncbi:hypothetical protein N865_18910 [Intrasporangium oryzae NRRL B-24470]|uniref:Hemerythrin-like domain-containing protein n=1 Tax=Intrasporangium oryzae NRRL B-24470 TaxID=1386089 RepID=W9GDK0_9MICO|nr:hypothetical protein [Intrasporangium oryzae]EWT03292.1 hypothetical protein N865_18910 [Intrasporangium oryzae NRRL B-24470]